MKMKEARTILEPGYPVQVTRVSCLSSCVGSNSAASFILYI